MSSESQMKEWEHTCFSAVLRHNEEYSALAMGGGQTPVKRAKLISSATEQLGKNDRDHSPLQIRQLEDHQKSPEDHQQEAIVIKDS